MIRLLEKYAAKMSAQGLARTEDIVFLGLDAELTSLNAPSDGSAALEQVFGLMNINSLLYAVPSEPYLTILRRLAAENSSVVTPSDCETRTFLHDIPVIDDLSAVSIAKALSRRRAAIVRGGGIVAYGTVSPEQAFVSFSSVCFSTFVKYFTDLQFVAAERLAALSDELQLLEPLTRLTAGCQNTLSDAAPADEGDVYRMIAAAGRALVSHRLVDSYFGNISYVYGSSVYISQTGSSMDELESCIDAVPLDGSSSTGITASSELSAHRGIFRTTGKHAILHGHPKFTVIMSMYCRREGCDISTCYRSCREPREVFGTPVVSGEIGTGPCGLFHTVPPAIQGSGLAVVFGHGVFATGAEGFATPFRVIHDLEGLCRAACWQHIHNLLRRS